MGGCARLVPSGPDGNAPRPRPGLRPVCGDPGCGHERPAALPGPVAYGVVRVPGGVGPLCPPSPKLSGFAPSREVPPSPLRNDCPQLKGGAAGNPQRSATHTSVATTVEAERGSSGGAERCRASRHSQGSRNHPPTPRRSGKQPRSEAVGGHDAKRPQPAHPRASQGSRNHPPPRGPDRRSKRAAQSPQRRKTQARRGQQEPTPRWAPNTTCWRTRIMHACLIPERPPANLIHQTPTWEERAHVGRRCRAGGPAS